MSAYTMTEIRCDMCDEAESAWHINIGQMRSMLKQYGWKRRDGEDICPYCSINRRKSMLRLARFVVAYAAVARTASGSVQEAMAEQECVSVSAIRERLQRAKQAGLYATTGSGRLGQPTAKAYKIIDEAQPVSC